AGNYERVAKGTDDPAQMLRREGRRRAAPPVGVRHAARAARAAQALQASHERIGKAGEEIRALRDGMEILAEPAALLTEREVDVDLDGGGKPGMAPPGERLVPSCGQRCRIESFRRPDRPRGRVAFAQPFTKRFGGDGSLRRLRRAIYE